MVKNITRSDITDAIYRQVGFPHTEAAKFIDQVLNEIVAALKRGEDVKISNFATFLVHPKGERVGRNPKTGDLYPIEPRIVVGFRASSAFKKALKG